ncbi:MAG: phytanoyl-CoA dioxygenase family protein [Actinobacteria bacterium]|nr:phytanoyl-CoA dioxygenase family protein [Actinomycetota bacterium]
MDLIRRFAPDSDPDDIARALTTAGAAIIERLVDEATVDQMLAEMQPFVDATPYGSDQFTGRTTKRTGALLARSPASIDFVANPEVLAVVDRVLGPNATTYQLHLTQMICIWPGGPAQSLHRDQWCFDMFPFPPEMDVEVSTIWALDDFTEENGATRIIPGSLLDAASCVADTHRTVGATMPKGSVVLYTGRTIHGGGENRSDAVRRALNVDYILGWLRQEENQYLSCPPEIARTLPERVQKLAGYTVGAFALGYMDDVRDPFAVLNGLDGGSSFGGRGIRTLRL